ncbi:hypothetical protein ABZ479_18390 [Streptomyces sp. NPDC005722]
MFDCAGEQVEVGQQRPDELSPTWNSADPRRPHDRPGFGLFPR